MYKHEIPHSDLKSKTGVCLVAQSCPTLCYPMDRGLTGYSPWRFSRQEYWNGLPCLLQGNFPTQGQTLVSCIAGRFFTLVFYLKISFWERCNEVAMIELESSSVDYGAENWKTEVLGWPKSSFRFFHTILQKNPNEIFDQPNTWDQMSSRPPALCCRLKLLCSRLSGYVSSNINLS